MPGEEVDPVPLAEAVDAVASNLGMGDARQLGVLDERWAEVVGEGVAAHARLRSLRRGVLTIAVDTGAWATELRYLVGDLRERAATILGEEAVREVRLVVSPEPPTGAP